MIKFITIFLFFYSSILLGQTDTIFKRDGKVLPCTITLVNESAVFFKDKKGYGDQLELTKIINYSQNGKIISVEIPLDTSKNALFIDNVNINKLDIKYCELSGFDIGFFGSQLIIYVDYGQFISNPQKMSIKNSKGSTIYFHSMIEALNFMEKNGWEYVNQYVSFGTTSLFGKQGGMYKFLLKRKL